MTALERSAPLAVEAAELPTSKVASPMRVAFAQFLRSPSGVVCACLLIVIVAGTIFGPMLYSVDPLDIAGAPFEPPSTDAWMGTDYLGRDVLAGLIYGGRGSLTVGTVAALITITIGLTVGSLSGFFGGIMDAALMKITEFFQVLPPLLFAMVLVTLFGPKLTTITVAIGAVSWTSAARITRAEFMRLRNLDFVKASRAAGAGNGYLILRVLLPNALPPVIVSATLAIGVAILFEGGLSFPGSRRSQQHELGADARAESQLRARRLVGGDISRCRNLSCRACDQPGGRRDK